MGKFCEFYVGLCGRQVAAPNRKGGGKKLRAFFRKIVSRSVWEPKQRYVRGRNLCAITRETLSGSVWVQQNYVAGGIYRPFLGKFCWGLCGCLKKLGGRRKLWEEILEFLSGSVWVSKTAMVVGGNQGNFCELLAESVGVKKGTGGRETTGNFLRVCGCQKDLW